MAEEPLPPLLSDGESQGSVHGVSEAAGGGASDRAPPLISDTSAGARCPLTCAPRSARRAAALFHPYRLLHLCLSCASAESSGDEAPLRRNQGQQGHDGGGAGASGLRVN